MSTLHFNQFKTGGRWTKEEHQKFLYGLKLYGKNWKKIEDLIESRTSTQIRSHAQKFFIKMKKIQKIEDDSQFHQNSAQSKFGQQTYISPQEEKNLEKERTVFSFYLERITSNFKICKNQGQQFNFWDNLIDYPKIDNHKSCVLLKIPHDFELDLKKIILCNQQEKKTKISSCQIIRTEFSCFGQYQA